MMTPFFIFLIASSLIMCAVAGSRGACREMMSDVRSNDVALETALEDPGSDAADETRADDADAFPLHVHAQLPDEAEVAMLRLVPRLRDLSVQRHAERDCVLRHRK